MKQLSFLTIGLVLLLSSCSTAYQAGQTPDDVYYSPGAVTGGEERVKKQKSRDDQQYQEYISSQDDAYLRRKVTNRSRWSSIDDFSYWNDYRYNFFPSTFNYFNPYFSCYSCNTFIPSYGGGHYFGGGFGFTPSLGWNNPYYTLVYYGTPTYKGGGGTVSTNNLAAARNKSINNNNNYYSLPKAGSNNNARESSFGNLIKTVFTNSGESFDRAARSFSPNTP
ncbi:MAG: hypothetical protein FYV88_4670, partial [Bacteroidetes bacterium]|nr:hypothetical protein [Bacteroidota bacterium]